MAVRTLDLPVFVGNRIGGMIFVAALNHAQVEPDEEKQKEKS